MEGQILENEISLFVIEFQRVSIMLWRDVDVQVQVCVVQVHVSQERVGYCSLIVAVLAHIRSSTTL